MLTLITNGKKHTIMGNAVYNIKLEKNVISPLRIEFNKLLYTDVLLNDDKQVYTIIGIEAFATPETYKHSDIGIMVIPSKNK